MHAMIKTPRVVGLWCAVAAVGLGLAYMAAAGAPSTYLALNALALGLGAILWRVAGSGLTAKLAGNGWLVMLFALPLLATAMFGAAVDGASRWLVVGPITLQTSLVLLPAAIVLFARNPDAAGAAGLAVAALALALQPDRAMAGVLAAAAAVLVASQPGRYTALVFLAALVAFAATLLRPDSLPAVPFVDQILYTAFDVGLAPGAAVLAGCLILIVPILALRGVSGGEQPALGAFAATWAAVIAAAALGNYPTPLVGYGASSILGYLLSVGGLPARERTGAGIAARRAAAG